MGPLSVGTDGAGSVRIPAAFCGNFGLKPSFGRVPAYPLSPFGTRGAPRAAHDERADAALMLNELARPDARDWTSLPYDARDYLQGLDDGIRGLRIAWSPTLGYAKNVHPEVAAACATAVDTLASSARTSKRSTQASKTRWRSPAGSGSSARGPSGTRSRPSSRRSPTPTSSPRPSSAPSCSALEIQRLNLRRGALGSQMRQFMQRFDLLVTPTVAVPAFDARPAGHTPMDPAAMLGWTPFSYPFNLTQQPACTIPCGLTSDGLPIGLQFVGPMFGDALVLRAARAYESVRPIPRPPLARAS